MSRRVQIAGGATYIQQDDGLLYREGSTVPVTNPDILDSAGIRSSEDVATYFAKLGKPVPTDFEAQVRGAGSARGPYQGPGSAFQQGISTPETQFYGSQISRAFTGLGGVSPEDYAARVALGASWKMPSKITSDILEPEQDISKGLTYPTDTTGISSARAKAMALAALTPEEQQIETALDKYQALSKELAGKAAYEAETTQRQEISSLKTTIADYTAQLRGFQAEEISISTQPAGVGQTATMLGAQQREQLRQTAIKTMQVTALLLGTQGKLSAAQEAVSYAVKAKYDPIEAEIDALETNLELIKAKPSYIAAQNAKKTEVARAKADTEDIWQMVTEYADKLDSVTANNLMRLGEETLTNPKAKFEALDILRNRGVFTKKIDATGQNIQNYLAEQGLPLTVATSKGELTTSALNKVVSAGVPIDVANHIWANMKEGNSLETIRQEMLTDKKFMQEIGQELGYKYLDDFMSSLQGKTETGTIKNPFD